MKKAVKLLGAAVVSLFICYAVGQQLKTMRMDQEALGQDGQSQEEQSQGEQSREEQSQEKGADTSWNLVDNMDTTAVILSGRVESDDYPYGYNLGAIEDDEVGKAVLLTAGTTIEAVVNIMGNVELELDYGIHPWVAEGSDGALLNLTVTAGDQIWDYTYIVSSDEQKERISLGQFPDDEMHIKMWVSNEEGQNEECDWVILREFALTGDSIAMPEPRSALSEKGYVRSATYFADEWPLNFWNSEMDSLEEDMRRIQEDGFDSIILVIPWREFQTGVSPVSYNEYAFDRLEEVVTAADVAGLGVYTRVGYEPDFYDGIEQGESSRQLRLMWDPVIQDAWYDYLDRMYKALSTHENFWGGFLTWEDFWNNLGVCDEPDEGARITWASLIGYSKWVEEHYTLETYRDAFGTEYASFSEIPVPRRTEPAMEAMYALYDDFLNRLLGKSQEKFPDLSMEVRTDWEPIYRIDGTMDYYKHTVTFPCMNASYVVTMYGIPMGFENVGERVGYREAMEKTDYILGQLKEQNGGKPVYIDQFIFADNTPAFSRNAQIKEKEMNDYLENVSEVLMRHSEGYGIWTYQDYRANLLYNAQFALEEAGWEMEGQVSWEEKGGSAACSLEPGSKIGQAIPAGRNHFGDDPYTFEADIVEVEEAGTLNLHVGNVQESVEVMEPGRISLTFEPGTSLDVGIEAVDCKLSIDNVKVYNYIQKGYLYDENGEGLQCLEGIRSLNAQLRQGQ